MHACELFPFWASTRSAHPWTLFTVTVLYKMQDGRGFVGSVHFWSFAFQNWASSIHTLAWHYCIQLLVSQHSHDRQRERLGVISMQYVYSSENSTRKSLACWQWRAPPSDSWHGIAHPIPSLHCASLSCPGRKKRQPSFQWRPWSVKFVICGMQVCFGLVPDCRGQASVTFQRSASVDPGFTAGVGFRMAW